MSARKAFTYVITNTIDGKAYYGKSVNPIARWSAHRSDARIGKMSYLACAIRHHGEQNFTFKILNQFETEDEAFLDETSLIREHKTALREFGYNLNEGGKGGIVPTDEVREKIGNANRGKKHSEAVKAKIRATKAAISPEEKKRLSDIISRSRKGKKLSLEHRAKLADALRGKKRKRASPEARWKMGSANRGKQLTEDHKKKIGAASLGRRVSEDVKQRLRKPKSESTKEKMRLAAIKRWEKKRATNNQISEDISSTGFKTSKG